MDYKELQKEYQKLLNENNSLKKENDSLKLLLMVANNADMNIEKSKEKRVAINSKVQVEFDKNSEVDKKIELFRDLFRGRTDVYAKKWVGKTGRSGYSPVCKNEWKQGICAKPAIKCTNCKYRKFEELSKEVTGMHLMGKLVIGMYPMLEDESCFFLAIDFDDEGWQEDTNVIREICEEKKIPIAIERSRSGDGAHVWFFFKDAISASVARKFGSSLLTYAMNHRHNIRFNSYDRLFPNQDIMPKGGLGNLIALPLQKEARAKGNSEFINKEHIAYEDQWQFLSTIIKISEIEVKTYINMLSSGNELGELRQTDESIEPWEKKSTVISTEKEDFPHKIKIIKANMLYIEKRGFSEKGLNQVKRLAAFKNPEFYKAQAMRLPTYDKPRIISTSDETEKYICLPRGCEQEVINLCKKLSIEIRCEEKRENGRSIEVRFNGKLRENQEDAVNEMIKHENGVLSATTAFGKTVVGANLIAKRKVNTLILVHTRQLLEQWKERLEEFLEIDEPVPEKRTKTGRLKKQKSIIGQIGASKNSLNGIVDIAIMQSALKDKEVKEFIIDYGMVIVDECHHVPAYSFEQILKNVHAKYVYGLTATPIRKDGHQAIIFLQCGPIRYTVEARKQAEMRPFEHYIVPRFTSFRLSLDSTEKEKTISEIYHEIYNSEMRNSFIAEDVLTVVKDGRSPIILTERTKHVELLSEILKGQVKHIISLTGSMSMKARRKALDDLSKIPKDENFVIIATGRLVGEGFDEPRLDTLFLAMPVAWKGTVAQYTGRLHRIAENKSEVIVYDYVDIHVSVLDRMYQKRLKGYAAVGYSVKSDNNMNEVVHSIYDSKSFLPVFTHDVVQAKLKIVIVSPFITKNRLNKIMGILYEALNNKVKVIIVTRPKDDYKENDEETFDEKIKIIEENGIEVIYKKGIHQKFSIIDHKIVWYGSINLLSYGSSHESMMRLVNLNIASELLDILN